MKTARQAGWSLEYTKSSSGFQFVSVRKVDGYDYAEFWFSEDTVGIEGSTRNDFALLDLPLSVVALIRFWFGTITFEEYKGALQNV